MDSLNGKGGQVKNNPQNSDNTPPDHQKRNRWGSRDVSPATTDPYLQKSPSIDSGNESSSSNIHSDQVATGFSVSTVDPDHCWLPLDDKKNVEPGNDSSDQQDCAVPNTDHDSRRRANTQKKLKRRAQTKRSAGNGRPGEKVPSRKHSANVQSSNTMPGPGSETILRQNRRRESDSRTDPFSSFEIIFATMSPDDCRAHLAIIKDIEAVLIDAIRSVTTKINHRIHPRSLDSKQQKKIRQCLKEWQQLAPVDGKITIRDQLKELLDKDNKLSKLRQLFPIHESGSFQWIDGKKRAISHYEGQCSTEVSRILDDLNSRKNQ